MRKGESGETWKREILNCLAASEDGGRRIRQGMRVASRSREQHSIDSQQEDKDLGPAPTRKWLCQQPEHAKTSILPRVFRKEGSPLNTLISAPG